MRIAGRRASDFLPPALRPLAREAGRELRRARLDLLELSLEAQQALHRSITHLHGPTSVSLGPTDLVVLTLCRNAAAHLPTFLRHYRRLGAAHVVLVDNGSTDETLEIARQHEPITMYRTTLPFRHYEAAIKRWMVRQFGRGDGWSLVADMDELLDYPFARRLPLAGFLAYLNRHGYTAVTAHNLEMLPDQPIQAIQGRLEPDLETTHRYYDISDIRDVTDALWLRRNEVDGAGHYSHTGGIWETVFGYPGSMLTKQPLFRASARGLRVFPYNVHFVTGARIADVTAVLRHYKYTGRFVAHVDEELRRRQHFGGAEIFRHYRRVLDENPSLSLLRPTSREYGGAEELLESGFLIASERFRGWAGAA